MIAQYFAQHLATRDVLLDCSTSAEGCSHTLIYVSYKWFHHVLATGPYYRLLDIVQAIIPDKEKQYYLVYLRTTARYNRYVQWVCTIAM